jgi:hypothetical protein
MSNAAPSIVVEKWMSLRSNPLPRLALLVATAAPNASAQVTTRVDVDSTGAEANGPTTPTSTQTSADGRYVVFASKATNLVSGDTNGVADVFVHDRQTGTTERVSVSSLGVQADGDCTT